MAHTSTEEDLWEGSKYLGHYVPGLKRLSDANNPFFFAICVIFGQYYALAGSSHNVQNSPI